METSQAVCQPFRFGDFELSEDTGELRRRGVRVRLSGQAFDVLVLLISARPRIVTREELQQRLWPTSSFGDFDHGLNAAVNRLREALNDSASSPVYVETVPRRGYRFIYPIESAASTSNPTPVIASPAAKSSSRLPFILLTAVLLIVSASLAVHLYRRSHTPPPPDDLTEAPFTTLSGSEIGPTFSPDGSQVAFEWDGENNGAGFDLYVQAVGAENPRRLTQQPSRTWVSAAWSPDGRTIATRSTELQNASLNLVPSTGGPPRRVAALYGEVHGGMRLLSWSPDSKTLAFVDHATSAAPELKRSDLFFLSLDTLERRRIDTHCISTVLPAFSYDGKTLAFACILGYDHFTIDILRLADGTTRRLFDSPGEISGLDWGPDGHFLYFARSSTGGNKTLWRIDPSRPANQIRIPAAAHISDFAINRATGRLVYAQYTQVANLWRLPLNPTGRAEPFIPSTRTQNNPNISPDGKRVAFESDRSGSREVWIANSEGRDLQQITSFNSLTGTARWSPDSTRLLLDSRTSGEANLYVYDTSNGSLRKVNTSTEANSLASWSSDGKSILYTVGREGEQPSIWQVPVAGGSARKLIDNGELPIPSPDGKWIYFRRTRPGVVDLMRTHTDSTGVELAQSWHVDNMSVAWWPSGSGFYIIRPQNNTEQIDFLDLATHRTSAIYTTPHSSLDWVGGLAVASDARWLLFNQIEQTSADLFLVNGIKPAP